MEYLAVCHCIFKYAMAQFYVSRRSSKCPSPHTVKKKAHTMHAVFIALIHYQMVSS